jgi:hypothetical protein
MEDLELSILHQLLRIAQCPFMEELETLEFPGLGQGFFTPVEVIEYERPSSQKTFLVHCHSLRIVLTSPLQVDASGYVSYER